MGLLLRFDTGRNVRANAAMQKMAAHLRADLPPGVEEIIPGYDSLLVRFKGAAERLPGPKEMLDALNVEAADQSALPTVLVEIPVIYGGKYGPDLGRVAQHAGLPPDEVVRRHAGRPYYVFCLGFAPGFPYLGGLPPSLHCPRRSEPRETIPGGSVGIGGAQTGIYPGPGPGGWRLIGATPCRLFNPEHQPPTALAPGYLVRFYPISQAIFRRIRRETATHPNAGLQVKQLRRPVSERLVQLIERVETGDSGP